MRLGRLPERMLRRRRTGATTRVHRGAEHRPDERGHIDRRRAPATVDTAGQACDAVLAIEANGFRTNPQELYDAAEAGSRSSNPAIRDKAQLLAAYSAMASASIQTGGDPAQHMRQLGGMVLDLLAACRDNGHG
ncbi:hypothetical protein ACFQ0O_22055 [Saccharopolyspora spinosporotrichia]